MRQSRRQDGVAVCLGCALPAMARVHSRSADPPARDARLSRQAHGPSRERTLSNAQLAATALHVRRRVAVTPIDGACIDGFTWVSAKANAVGAHPLGARHARLVGECFEHSGGQYRVELVAPGEVPPHDFGVWAYDTGKWADATNEVQRRCTFFGREVLRRLLQAADAKSKGDSQPPHRPPRARHGPELQRVRSAARSTPAFVQARGRIRVTTEPEPERAGWIRVSTSGGTELDCPFLTDGDMERDNAMEAFDSVLVSGGYPMPIDSLCDGDTGMSFERAASLRHATLHTRRTAKGSVNVGPERTMWHAIREWGRGLAMSEGGCRLNVVCGRLCKGRACHAWLIADAIADAAVAIETDGCERLQAIMRGVGMSDFSALGWHCVVTTPASAGEPRATRGKFTSPGGARVGSFGQVEEFMRGGGDGRVQPGRMTVGHLAEGGGEWCAGMHDLRIDRQVH